MSDIRKSIKQIYDEGMAEVYKVVGSLTATPDQRETAKQTAADLSSMLIAHTLDSISGRTALLSGLIVELNQMIDSVKVHPPYLDAVTNFTSILAKAATLFQDEKKNLV
jgi:hypothetical protein